VCCTKAEMLKEILCPLDCRISSLDHAEAVQYAGLLSMLCQKSRSAVRELDPSNDVTFLRLRSHKHEILVAPGMDLCACIFTFAHVLDMSRVLYFRPVFPFYRFLFLCFYCQLAYTRHRKVIPMQHATDTVYNGADKEYILMVIQAPQVKAPIKEVKKDPV